MSEQASMEWTTADEALAADVHRVYCRAYEARFGKPYWSGGDFSKLDGPTQDYDRAFVKWHKLYSGKVRADNERLTALLAEKERYLEVKTTAERRLLEGRKEAETALAEANKQNLRNESLYLMERDKAQAAEALLAQARTRIKGLEVNMGLGDDLADAENPHINELSDALRDRDALRAALAEKEVRLAMAVEALNQIQKGAGPFSRDPLEHASNTIEAMKDLASTALSATQTEVAAWTRRVKAEAFEEAARMIQAPDACNPPTYIPITIREAMLARARALREPGKEG